MQSGKDYKFPVLLSSCKNEATDMVTFVYIWDDGTISKRKFHKEENYKREYINERFIRWAYQRLEASPGALERFFASDWPGVSLAKHLCNHSFRTVEEVLVEIKRRIEADEKQQKQTASKATEWNAQVADASDVYIGLDEVGILKKGIEVWILLNSRYSFEEQLKLIRENQKKLVKYIIRDMRRSVSADCINAIKMLDFVERVNTKVGRYNSAIFFFEFGEEQELPPGMGEE